MSRYYNIGNIHLGFSNDQWTIIRKLLIWLLLLVITFLVILVVVILLMLLWKGEKMLGRGSLIPTHLYQLPSLRCLIIENIVPCLDTVLFGFT